MAFILIVDADERLAMRASDVLTSAGHACAWVGDAQRANILLRHRKPDLVLLDQRTAGNADDPPQWTLPSSPAAEEVPIILLTSEPNSGGKACLAELRKPFDPQFLVWQVNHALQAGAAAPRAERTEAWAGGRISPA